MERARSGGVRVIANAENRGFAAAVNQGFRATDTELVLILNPDVRIASGLEPLKAAALEHGLAGGRLADEQGHTQAGLYDSQVPYSYGSGPGTLGSESPVARIIRGT